MQRNSSNGHFGVGISYKPQCIKRSIRMERVSKLREALKLCDKMLLRQTRKQRPHMVSILKWTDKRARIVHEIDRLINAG